MSESSLPVTQSPVARLVTSTKEDIIDGKSMIETRKNNAVEQAARAGEEMEAARIRKATAEVRALLYKQMTLYCEHFNIKEKDLGMF